MTGQANKPMIERAAELRAKLQKRPSKLTNAELWILNKNRPLDSLLIKNALGGNPVEYDARNFRRAFGPKN